MKDDVLLLSREVNLLSERLLELYDRVTKIERKLDPPAPAPAPPPEPTILGYRVSTPIGARLEAIYYKEIRTEQQRLDAVIEELKFIIEAHEQMAKGER